MSRMKNIYRWGLMRNTRRENLSEHSLEVAQIAHALAIINSKPYLVRHCNEERVTAVEMSTPGVAMAVKTNKNSRTNLI